MTDYTPRSTSRPALVTIALAAIIALAGVIIMALNVPTASFGWFAYAPLSDTAFTPSPGSVLANSPLALIWVGAAIAFVGVAVLFFAIGLLVGRRRSRRA